MDILDIYHKYLTNKERVYDLRKDLLPRPKLIAILRVRNEELILQDTLDHLSSFCDWIIAYDDASTDKTFEILHSHKDVISIIRNFHWDKMPETRILNETVHRLILLVKAKTYNPEWVFCADADERYLGDIRVFVDSAESKEIDLVRISLYDAYITEKDQDDYVPNTQLLNFRKYFGPERRDIVMLWKATNDNITFVGKDSREPTFPTNSNIKTKFACQHYGKSLSIMHWEETCEYYVNYMPYEFYGAKWEARKGKAIHTKSDFDRNLYQWGDQLFKNSVQIHPKVVER